MWGGVVGRAIDVLGDDHKNPKRADGGRRRRNLQFLSSGPQGEVVVGPRGGSQPPQDVRTSFRRSGGTSSAALAALCFMVKVLATCSEHLAGGRWDQSSFCWTRWRTSTSTSSVCPVDSSVSESVGTKLYREGKIFV